MRVALARGWAEVKDLRRINYGEAKKLRRIISAGEEEGADKAIIECVTSWEVYDSNTDEVLTDVSLATLDRLDPKEVVTIATVIGEGLQSALPLAQKNGSAPS